VAAKDYNFKFLQTEHDFQIANELFASCFAANNSYFNNFQSIEKQLAFNPVLNPENYWLLLLGDQVIGATQIFTFPIRIGIATLQIGGIGGVCTLPAFRRQGFNEALLNHCLVQMRQLNLDLSLLGGIPDYYHRFGYAVVMPTYQLKIPSRLLLDFTPTHPIRPFTPEDLPGLKRLFEQEFFGLPGVHARTSEFWRYHFKLNPAIYVAETPEKQLAGYLWLETRKEIWIKEAAAENGAVAESLLHFVAQQAQPRFQPEITGDLHPEQPFIRFLQPRCDISITTQHRSNGGWMARMINLAPTFQKLAPELSLRLQASSSASVNFNLGFKTDLGDLVLTCQSGQVQVAQNAAPSHGFIELSQATLTQMIYGYHHFSDLISRYSLQVPEEYLPVIQALFPKKSAYLGGPDHF
jgi:predicted acetyltransferase